MEHMYNTQNKVFCVEDYQHPSEKKTVERLTKLPGFNKILAFISKNSIEKTYHLMNDSSLMKITKEMSPKIHTMVEEAAEMFGVTNTPEVYLERNYDFQVRLDGIDSPFIVFSSSVLEQYSDDMLWAMICSEVAGIQVHFSEIKFVEKMIDYAKAMFPFGIDTAVTLAMNDWRRCNAYSFDRAFLLACEDFEMAAKNILFGEADAATLNNIGLAEQNNDYYLQAKEFLERSGGEGIYQKFTTVFSKKQWAASRYIELYNWYFSGMFEDALERSKKG